ncbi:hypothetical protein TIFTF001_016618 [Ficus carica]|uniref:Uncharacterized protein n=1 Tax=Ficus carica TaxID=3494 RepID=A0AA88DA11_FICCA|nr:hypothetical protein TIFTF001_016618 [Ficus carica]
MPTLLSRLCQISVEDSSLSSSTEIGSGFCKAMAILFGCFEIKIGSPKVDEALTRDIVQRPQDCENRDENREESHEENRAIPPAMS